MYEVNQQQQEMEDLQMLVGLQEGRVTEPQTERKESGRGVEL